MVNTEKDGKYVLAIDLGTSGPKVALVSSNFEVVSWAFEPISIDLLDNGGAEQDPAMWWNAIKKATKKVLSKDKVATEHVVAVSCTAQWSGTVCLDEEGQYLAPAMIWMDSRGAEQVKDLNKASIKLSGYDAFKLLSWLKMTGGAPGQSGKDPLAHILYIKEKKPELYKKVYKFLEPKDYINLLFTGKFYSTFETIALHWVTDNRKIDKIHYSEKLLKIAGIERSKLPDLKAATDILGVIKPSVARELGLGEKTVVIGGTADLHSAVLGSGAIHDYEANLCVGTSSFLSCHVPFKKTDVLHNIVSLPSAIPGKYFVVNEQHTSGVCLNFLKDNILFPKGDGELNLSDREIFKKFNEMAATVPSGSEGLIFTPWLYGERTPVENHTVRGGFHNLSLKTRRENLVRSVMEGVAFNSRWLLKYVEKFVKKPFPHINIIGGGAQSDLWCQIFADILERKIRKIKDPRFANARGAAVLALVALNLTSFEETSQKIVVEKEFIPEKINAPIYRTLFKEYLSVYASNKNIYARLNGSI